MFRNALTTGLRFGSVCVRAPLMMAPVSAVSGLSVRRFASSSEESETESDHDEYWGPGEPPMVMPRPQSHAPHFAGKAVVNKTFKDISLSDYKGKWLVLFFYPLDFTFVCPTEIVAFSDAAPEFNKVNCEVVACSTDSHFSHLAWINLARKDGGLGDMKIPVLADFKKETAKKYGVLHKDLGVAFRGLFLIDPEGIVRHVSCNDLPVGRNVQEALRLVEAFQFVAKHGEVCPANWKPGSDTMKPDPVGSKEYFNKVNK